MKKTAIIGNVCADATTQQVNEKTVINFTVAVNENRKDKDGNKTQNTTYIDCSFWRKAGQSTAITEYLKKGVQVYCSGSPTVSAFINKEGHPVGKLALTISDIELLSAKKETVTPSEIEG